MIYLYLFALVLGGVLLGASMLLGGHGDGHAPEAHADGPDANAGVESFLVAFLSMRFWTFFLAFFGLTGVVLDGFGLVSSTWIAATLSVGMGLFAGGAAAWIMRRVRGDESNSAATSKDFVGKTGRVLVPVGPEQVGKVRLEIRGSTVDILAVSIEEATFDPKDEIIVIEVDGTRVKVAKLTPERLSRP